MARIISQGQASVIDYKCAIDVWVIFESPVFVAILEYVLYQRPLSHVFGKANITSPHLRRSLTGLS